MLEEFFKQGLSEIMAQGFGYVLFLAACGVVWRMDIRYTALQTSCGTERAAAEVAVKSQYEKRLEEFRDLLDVMTRNTTALSSLQGSVDARSETLQTLVVGVAKLSHEFEAMQSKWDDRGAGMGRQLEDMQRRLESLQQRGARQ